VPALPAIAGNVWRVPAPFIYDLCGYRPIDEDHPDIPSDKPNMSDAHQSQSVLLGRALLDTLGVPRDKIAPADPGNRLEELIADHLQALRPDLRIKRGRSAREFSQYAHLGVFDTFQTAIEDLRPTVADLSERVRAADLGRARTRIESDLDSLITSVDQQAVIVDDLVEQMPAESLLKIDISVAVKHEGELDELAIALSSKWTLRTDRAQDCVSQGNKLVAQRRGRMPHFGVITIEPRPAMLRILADGSGAIDFVYHLDLSALSRSIAALVEQRRSRWSKPAETFSRLMRQKRLRDFDDLVQEVMRVPGP
jgi:hypothetical protein